MIYHLVVARPFLKFVRGDIISDIKTTHDILAGEHRKFVMKFAAPNTKGG